MAEITEQEADAVQSIHEMETILRGLLKTFNDADLERLKEVYERDEEADRWKSEGDMYGWNFHKGAASGCTSASIIFFRVKREIEKYLGLLSAPRGVVSPTTPVEHHGNKIERVAQKALEKFDGLPNVQSELLKKVNL